MEDECTNLSNIVCEYHEVVWAESSSYFVPDESKSQLVQVKELAEQSQQIYEMQVSK
jgi:hypothetical protein